jgi:hypothetical protein
MRPHELRRILGDAGHVWVVIFVDYAERLMIFEREELRIYSPIAPGLLIGVKLRCISWNTPVAPGHRRF